MADSILNAEQVEAIVHEKGPLLIIAGAGTGKTTVVTKRIEHLILQKKIPPSEILALTFTEKAAREMEERVDVALPYGYTQLWIATYHAFCERVLRDEALHIGLDPSFKLISEADGVMFLRKYLFEFDLDYFRPLGNPTKFLSALLQHFSRLKDEDISTEEYLNFAHKLQPKTDGHLDENDNADTLEAKKTMELALAYRKYEELKVRESVMDFSDLISQTLYLFRKRKNVLEQYRKKFRYILVDEFQDTNYAQNQLAILLTGEKKNITVVGDDDQAIYRWRGAAISNMIQFKKHFPTTKIITLKKNYRSTAEILNKSYDLIQHNNPDRLEVKEKINKKLISMRELEGEKVEFLMQNRVEDEAEAVIKKIQELTEQGIAYKDIAILVRANDYAQPFVRQFERYQIPFQFLGPAKLFQKDEIRDLISYLKVLYNFEDSAALYRVLSMPILHIDPRDIAQLLNVARKQNRTLFEAMEESVKQQEIETTPLQKVYALIKDHLSLVSTQTAGQILFDFLNRCGLYEKFSSAVTEEEQLQIQNIAKFFGKIKSFEAANQDASVFSVVDWLELSMQLGESPQATDSDWSDVNAVNILTIHSSKGLEFPVVFIVNLVSQRFPSRDRKETIPIPQELIKELLPEGDYHIQEERRLFYVAMTRAKDRLFLTAAKYYGEGKRERKLSPFIYEVLEKETIEKIMDKQSESKTLFQTSLLDWEPKIVPAKPSAISYSPFAITYISYSQIQTFDFCPLHYKLKYILKIPTPPSPAQVIGTSIHGALRDYYQKALNGKVTDKDLETFLNKNWTNEGFDTKAHAKAAKAKARTSLENYVAKNFDPKNLKTAALEIPFNFSLQTTDGSYIKVGGRIDRVDALDGNRIEIIDYKTGDKMLDEKDLETDLQLTFYALAATKVHDDLFGKKPEEILLSLHYVEKNQIVTTARTMEQLAAAEQFILLKVDEISHSDFLCSGATFCANCEYKILCSVK